MSWWVWWLWWGLGEKWVCHDQPLGTKDPEGLSKGPRQPELSSPFPGVDKRRPWYWVHGFYFTLLARTHSCRGWTIRRISEWWESRFLMERAQGGRALCLYLWTAFSGTRKDQAEVLGMPGARVKCNLRGQGNMAPGGWGSTPSFPLRTLPQPWVILPSFYPRTKSEPVISTLGNPSQTTGNRLRSILPSDASRGQHSTQSYRKVPAPLKN